MPLRPIEQRLTPVNLRPQTAIRPNLPGTLIIPNQHDREIPDVLTGLVSQADVQTNGNVDVAPFDNILGNLATLVNGPIVSAPGDGGFVGMLFDGVNQTLTLPSTLDNNLFLEGDFTMAARYKMTAVGEMGLYAFGPTALCSLKAQQNGGDPQSFCIDDGGQISTVSPTQVGGNDGVEHVLGLRRSGGRLQLTFDNALIGDVNGNYGNGGSTTTNHQEWASFYDDVAIIFMAGTIFWSAAWDRLLSDSQMLYLPSTPNPFGRTP